MQFKGHSDKVAFDMKYFENFEWNVYLLKIVSVLISNQLSTFSHNKLHLRIHKCSHRKKHNLLVT
jgi:hypothetical protein